ncbi:MFS transporter [Actinomadura rupiterrae]|uniref:MFS transporter n=1 Tax=Actinomadura rupiterrae TaxID=559627 RepID=UPI0020A3EFE2|nr:MFS transporter [Actinomadura rupiterrae]MCP2339553.1 EmrB/QacA subfamily drug resistance transporter [Actinomadura rupiterrae]
MRAGEGLAASPAQPSASSPRHSGLVLAVIVGCQLMVGVDSSVVTIALPDIRGALDLSTGGLAWVQNAYTLAFGGLLLLGGRSGDIIGRRRAFCAGISVFTLASLLGGVASDGWILISARALQGVGAALAAPSAMVLIATLFSGTARVRALGVSSAVTGVGGALGMLLGGLLTDLSSWRLVFFINLPIGVVILLAAPRVLPETPRRSSGFDFAGAVLGTLGLTALVFGLIRAGSDGWHDTLMLAPLGAAVVLFVAFVLAEERVPNPLVPLRLLTDRLRAGAFISLATLVGGMFGGFFFLTQYFQQNLGYGPLKAGAAFLPIVGTQFVVLRFAPRLLGRFGGRTLVMTGAFLMTTAMLWLTAIDPHQGYATGLLGPFLLYGGGAGLTVMPLNVVILGSVRPEDSGAAAGVAQTVLWSGATIGTSIMVTVFDATAGTDRHASLDGFAATFVTGACFGAIALLIALFTLRSARAPG